MRQAMSAACWTLTILVGWLTVACGQSCLPEVNPHSYCGDSSCPPEDRIVGNPTDYCRTFFQFQPAHIFPDEWELLFDSDDYRQNNVLGSVFLEREFDSDASTLRERDRTWIQQGGECQRQFRACAWSQGQQENWLFSNHIKYPPGSTTAGGGYSTEVYLNITYRFSSCNPHAGCTNNFVTLYRYDTNGIVLEAERTKKTNYALLFGQGTENTDSRFQQIDDFNDDNVLRSFTTSGSTGFHLGIRDTGTCGYVDRIILYYTPCMKSQNGLVSYPELVRPPEGSPPNVAQACCAPNSHNTTSLSFNAYSVSDGRCEHTSVICECDAGYILNATGTGCDPCAAGLYRSENDPHDRDCLACPRNTIGTEENAAICSCAENYFRCDGEGPEIGCTSPPIHPGPPICRFINGTSIQIEWDPPSDQGGRMDTFYIVEYQAIGSTGDYIAGDSTPSTSYAIPNLEPVTQYRIRVVAENCVSEQDMRPGIRASRTSGIVICKTGEGTPEAPSSPQVVENIVFLWQPPIKPNGNITGFQIDIAYNSLTEDSGNVSPPELDAMTFHYVLRKGVIPENVTATITVTAKTSAGLGEPSDPILFEPFASAAVEKVIEQCTLEEMGLSIALSAVIAAAVTAVVFFVILCCAYCICKCKNKGADDTSKNGYTNKASNAYDMPEKNVNWT